MSDILKIHIFHGTNVNIPEFKYGYLNYFYRFKNFVGFEETLFINIEDYKVIKGEFKKNMQWFEEEFDTIFRTKRHDYSKRDFQLASQLLDKLSETINQYKDERLLYHLVSTLNNIEKKYPEFFQ
jgi:hypothetical protein